jgi:hypothetical protein
VRWLVRIGELKPTERNPLGDAVRQIQELSVNFLVGRVQQSNLERGRIDRRKGEHEVSDTSKVQLVWHDIVTPTSAVVPAKGYHKPAEYRECIQQPV